MALKDIKFVMAVDDRQAQTAIKKTVTGIKQLDGKQVGKIDLFGGAKFDAMQEKLSSGFQAALAGAFSGNIGGSALSALGTRQWLRRVLSWWRRGTVKPGR